MLPSDTAIEATETFEAHRPLLFSIAYRMLGSVAEAEDMVQEAFLRFCRADLAEVRSPRAYLTTVVSRLCLDQLKSARARREQYIGPWLPDPLITAGPDAQIERLDEHASIGIAFLILMERLSPVERAVFLLHEVFDYSHTEIGEIVHKSEAACRQIFHRAKTHLVEGRPRFSTTPEAGRRLVEAFLLAATVGDMPALIGMLDEDVIHLSDAGGTRPAALRPIHGRDAVARMVVGIARKELGRGLAWELVELNGLPGVLFRDGDTPDFALSFETDGEHIHALYASLHPEKLAHLGKGTMNAAR